MEFMPTVMRSYHLWALGKTASFRAERIHCYSMLLASFARMASLSTPLTSAVSSSGKLKVAFPTMDKMHLQNCTAPKKKLKRKSVVQLPLHPHFGGDSAHHVVMAKRKKKSFLNVCSFFLKSFYFLFFDLLWLINRNLSPRAEKENLSN